MFGKLLKYELRSTSRFMWILYCAVICAGLISGLTLRFVIFGNEAPQPDGSSIISVEGFKAVLATISISVYVLLIVAMEVLTIVMIVLRFWKNMLGGEGYLMHTLPVPSWMLVTSKTVIAILWELMAGISALISGTLVLLTSGIGFEILKEINLREMFADLREFMNIGPTQLVLLAVFAGIAGILQFYFSMALGNLANKNKVLFSVLAYLGINVAVSVIRGIISFIGISLSSHIGATGMMVGIIGWPTVILYLLMAVGFFFGTYLIMENRLNLE